LINATGSLLRPYSLVAQKYAKEVLEQKGVQVLNDTTIVKVTDKDITTLDGVILTTDIVIWTAGVLGTTLHGIDRLLAVDSRVEVTPSLQLASHPEVFVLGDMAYLFDDEGPYPMLAQVAKRYGKHAMKNLECMISGKELQSFHYSELGRFTSLGQLNVIAEFRWFHLYGGVAWFVWRTIYLFNFASTSKRLRILVDWTTNIFVPRGIMEIK